MAVLILSNIICYVPLSSTDQVFLLVNGRDIWNGWMSSNYNIALNNIEEDFGGQATITVEVTDIEINARVPIGTWNLGATPQESYLTFNSYKYANYMLACRVKVDLRIVALYLLADATSLLIEALYLVNASINYLAGPRAKYYQQQSSVTTKIEQKKDDQ